MRGWGVLAVFLLGCAPPRRDYDADQIAAATSLRELMDVQETVTKRRFKLARSLDADTVSPADYEEFADMGARLQLTARRLHEWSRGRQYDEYARELFSRAGSLATYARIRDPRNTLLTARSIRETCAACHGEFR